MSATRSVTVRLLVLVLVLVPALPSHAETPDTPAPQFSIGRKGFGFESEDGASSLYTHWLVAVDFQSFVGKLPPGVTTRGSFVAKSAGLQLDAVLHRYLHSQLFVDFSQSRTTLLDAWVQIEALTWLKFRAGKFQFPINEERLTSPINLPFVSTSFASVLLPTRDIGIQLFGTLASGRLRYNLALTNGAIAGTLVETDADSAKDVVGRVFVRPFAGTNIAPLAEFGIGVGASTGTHRGSAASPSTPILRTYGGQTFFAYRPDAVADGRITRVVPHATWAFGPVAAYADYVRVDERVAGASIRTIGWSVVPSLVLTGESAAPLSFIVPEHPFDPSNGHIGTVLVTGGVGSIAVSADAFGAAADPSVAMREATVIGGGVNWYPFAGIAMLVDYGYMWFAADRNAPVRPAEHTVIARLEVAL